MEINIFLFFINIVIENSARLCYNLSIVLYKGEKSVSIKADDINKKGLDAQELSQSELQENIAKTVANYYPPTSQSVKDHLEWFRDQKLGLMVHWGLYNEIGIKESWVLVDKDWTKWQFKPGTPNKEVKEIYSKLHKGFMPLRFDPEEWAERAEQAGFRYLCFTTKHHDGFCMWDTATTDYKVTGSEVPFRSEKHADITRALFDSFRKRGMGISAYYSRADFSCPYYWEEGYGMKDGTERVPSYDPNKEPEKWQKFKDFVFAQLKELVSDYGKIDILWYDGGCDGEQLGLPEMTEELRQIQPHLLGVVRTSRGGRCQDFITPELIIPNRYIDTPWEACTVMGKPIMEYGRDYVSFGYTFDQDYMSAKEIAHLLLDVVAKGGNLALNVAAQPDGRLPGRALIQLEELGRWMKIFSPAIYETREAAPYRYGSYAYTRSKDRKRVNVFLLYGDGERIADSYTFRCEDAVRAVGFMRGGECLDFSQKDGYVTAVIPEALRGREGDIADCFVLEI